MQPQTVKEAVCLTWAQPTNGGTAGNSRGIINFGSRSAKSPAAGSEPLGRRLLKA